MRSVKLDPRHRPTWWRAYSFTLVTALMFLGSWGLQLLFQYHVVKDDAAAHGERFSWPQFWPQFWASTMENWQSEALQLTWQAAGLALLYHWGSSQSREGTDRIEAKVDEMLRRIPDRRLYDRRGDTGELRR